MAIKARVFGVAAEEGGGGPWADDARRARRLLRAGSCSAVCSEMTDDDTWVRPGRELWDWAIWR